MDAATATGTRNQPVTVRTPEDDNGVDEPMALSHAACGGDYGT